MKTKKPKKSETPKYVSVKKYSQMCGVTTQMVYIWIKDGLVVTEPRSFGKVIDLAKNPVRKKTHGGRKTAEAYLEQEAQSGDISL